MAVDNVIVDVVDVGQGQCTFVELRNNSNKLTNCLLFDCGSDKTSAQTEENLQWMADQISAMSTPTIDCIFFSHSDKDHISLTKSLLDKCSKKPKISKVFYGGNYSKYTKNHFNILDYIVKQNYIASSNVCGLNSNSTDYDKSSDKFNHVLWSTGSDKKDVQVHAIAANAVSSDPDWDDDSAWIPGANAEQLNRVSLVCALFYNGTSMVICGDATNTTMAAINQLFKDGTTLFGNNAMLTMPHHGSRATGLAVARAKVASDSAILTVDTFAKTLGASSYSVSAYEKHRHPSLELINHFVPRQSKPILKDPRLVATNAHQIAVYADVPLKNSADLSLFAVSYTFATRSNVFTTLYRSMFDAPGGDYNYNLGDKVVGDKQGVVFGSGTINPHACWRYEVKADGAFLLGGYASMASSLFTGPTSGLLSKSLAKVESSAENRELTMKALLPEPVTFRRVARKVATVAPRNAKFTSSKVLI
jgi:beta-lactamase superfamily II metal-dependent hydrolase